MRIVRFLKEGETLFGVLGDKTIRVLGNDPFDTITITGTTYDIDEVKLLAPVMPSKVVAVGLNYRSHAIETNNYIFQAAFMHCGS